MDHRRKAAGAIVVSQGKRERQGAPSTSAEQGIHNRIDAILSGSTLIQEIARLRKRADSLCTAAEASKDGRTALLAIRELTRLLELQGRLTLEAQQGRAADVASHPVWMSLASDIMQSLSAYPDAARAVSARIRERLGVAPDIVVHAELVPPLTEPDLPFPL